jgi:hypothetical protein
MSLDADRTPAHTILLFRPEPIQTLMVSFQSADGTAYTAIIRRWTASAASRCSLCRTCTAKVGVDHQALCIVAIEGPSEDKDLASLYSPDGLS